MIKLLTKKNYYRLIEEEKPEYMVYNDFSLKGVSERMKNIYGCRCVYFIETMTGNPFVWIMDLKKLLIPKKYDDEGKLKETIELSPGLTLENWEIEFTGPEKKFITNNYHRDDYDYCRLTFDNHEISTYPNYKRGNYKITNTDFPKDDPIEISLWDNQSDPYIFRDYIYIGSALKDNPEVQREEKLFIFSLTEILITEWITQKK